MKTQLINSMLSFTLGTGASILGLSMWMGTSDLQAIKDSVQNYVTQTEQQTSALVDQYNVMVNDANAEIEDYQQALEQANSNIAQLITAYETQKQQSEQDLVELQAELDSLYTIIDIQYEERMNEVIQQANAEIDSANQEVSDTKIAVEEMIEGSSISDIVEEEKSQLDTSGDKTVTDISTIISEVEGE